MPSRAIAKLLRDHPTPWEWRPRRPFRHSVIVDAAGKVVTKEDGSGPPTVAIVNAYAASLKKGKRNAK